MTNCSGNATSVARVVLVDDHPIVVQGLKQLLEQEDTLEVCGSAVGAAEAMQVIANTRPDIVITDLSLAQGSGLELVKDIRSRFPGIPVLVLSVRDETIYAERSLRAGARGYVMKDEAGEKIREAIFRVLGGGIYLSDAMQRDILQKVVEAPQPGGASPADCLSDRELCVFEMIGQGLGAGDIASRLHLSPKTIETYRAKIKEKLRLADATELRRRAIQWVQSQGLL
ncbi:MAG TPA: response regulator transcription factor [Candidatus Brocadiia bacterium]|nr:response regulator transcription factor [Candidatus Brocadiia bacterium]